jgi:cytochrome b subunit of formate dehydrogenase
MRKARMHYVLDILEGLILLLLVVSGFILWFALPEESVPGKMVLFDRHTWILAHRWLAVALLVFFSTHVLTHWTWLWYMTKKFFSKSTKDRWS